MTDTVIKLKELENTIMSIVNKYNISEEDTLTLGLALNGVAMTLPEGSFDNE